jgi:cell wall-associated NlpC family hydrolase
VHYWRSDTAWPSDPIKAVLTGKPIPVPDRSSGQSAIGRIVRDAQATGALPIAPPGPGNAPTGPAAGSQASGGGDRIAAQSLKYMGASYVFGGRADRVGNWDCSSFTSYILGHDLGYPLPGGKWGDAGMPPHTHGPTTNSYLLWGKPVSASQVQKGDLVVSSEHMGIVVDTGGTYMSAKAPLLGTNLGNWTKSFPGGSPVFRRVT